MHQFGLPQVSGLTVTMAELARLIPDASTLSFDRFESSGALETALQSDHATTGCVVGLNLHIEVFWHFSLALAGWCRRTRTPLYLYVHDYWRHHRNAVATLTEAFGAQLLAITREIASDLAADGFVPQIVRAGIVVPDQPSPAPDLPEGLPTIGAVGRLTPRKRLYDVLGAFCHAGLDEYARLYLRVPPSLVFGADQDQQQLEGLDPQGRRCGRPGAVIVDCNARAGTDYTEWAVYVSASEYEGLSMTPLEAIAQGCPIIVSDIAPHRRIVEALFPDHAADHLFPVGDQRALARLLQDELGTGRRRREVAVRSEEIHDLLDRDWSLRRTAGKLVELARRG